MFFQLDVKALTVGVFGHIDTNCRSGLVRNLTLANRYGAAPGTTFLQVMDRVGVAQSATRRRSRRGVVVVVMVGGQRVVVALLLHREEVVVATRLQ